MLYNNMAESVFHQQWKRPLPFTDFSAYFSAEFLAKIFSKFRSVSVAYIV